MRCNGLLSPSSFCDFSAGSKSDRIAFSVSPIHLINKSVEFTSLSLSPSLIPKTLPTTFNLSLLSRLIGLDMLYSVFYSAFRFFKIFFANGSLISMCRGSASTTPFLGLIQREWEAILSLRSKSRRFIRSTPFLE